MAEIATAKLSIDPALLPSGASARVLDVGCGDGRHIAEAALRGCYAVGVDYDPAELHRARQRLGTLGVALVAADASRLPFRDGAFDAAICTETFEHLPDDVGAMRELSRTLRAGGTLLGAVPSHFTELVFFRLSRGYRNAPGGHVRIYAPKRLFDRLRGEGFSIASMRYVHFVDSLFWLRFCIGDATRPVQPRSDFEAAVLLAVAQERRVPSWRRRLREAVPRSRLISAIDAVGALVWPKSLVFVAKKRGPHSVAAPAEEAIAAGIR
jgi:SAM-dependent methyltransferase